MVKADEDLARLRKSLEALRCQNRGLPSQPLASEALSRAILERWQNLPSLQAAKGADYGQIAAMWEFLNAQGTALLQEAKSEAQLHVVDQALSALVEELRAKEQSLSHLLSEKRAAIAGLDRLQDMGKGTAYFSVIQAVRNAAVEQIGSAVSLEALQDAADFAKIKIDEYLIRHEEEELLRREEELRFAPQYQEQAPAIVEALDLVRSQLLLELRYYWTLNARIDLAKSADLRWLASEMTEDATLRHFMYREMQFLRRIANQIAAQSDGVTRRRLAEGALLRLENDLRAVYSVFPGISERILYLEVLRESLRSLHKDGALAEIDGAANVPTLNLFDRETIVSDAQNSSEVYIIVMSAGLPLAIPWTDSSGDALTQAYLRRWKYRRVYLRYLALRYPTFFRSREQAVDLIQDAYKEADERYIALSDDLQDRVRNHVHDKFLSRDELEELLGVQFRLLLVTTDPLWLLEPLLPYLRLYLDLKSFCVGGRYSERDFNHLAHNFGLRAARVPMYRELLESEEIQQFEAVFGSLDRRNLPWLNPPTERSSN